VHRDKFANVQWKEKNISDLDPHHKINPADVDESLGLRDPLQNIEQDLKSSVGSHLNGNKVEIPIMNFAGGS
jgi:hypothetical protein